MIDYGYFKRFTIRKLYEHGIDITLHRVYSVPEKTGKKLINVGAGEWKCDGWVNLDYSSEWYSSQQKKQSFIEYDIRNDDIPIESESVDCVYCSHVIEHIENEYDEKFLCECHRILKKGGVVRIACPDAEFLWMMTKAGKDWWIWRKEWCRRMKIDYEVLRPVDLLVREIATPKMIGYGYLADHDYQEEFESMVMIDFFEFMKEGLAFNVDHVGDHINYWTFNKLREALKFAGFSIIVRSKYGGSISPFMKSKAYFDNTEPGMSLYVEAIKE